MTKDVPVNSAIGDGGGALTMDDVRLKNAAILLVPAHLVATAVAVLSQC